MRLFQNSGIPGSYRARLTRLASHAASFDDRIEVFLNDRFGSAHFLKPVLERSPDAFFANGNDDDAQTAWAREKGLRPGLPLHDILLAQIEEHRTEIFYNLDPMTFGDDFLVRLPGSVRCTVAWRAAPSAGGKFLRHDVIVNNFPSILEGYRSEGVRAEWLFPAHDPVMDAYSVSTERPVDVLFIGTYSRHHQTRAAMLEAIARLRGAAAVAMHLDVSRHTRLAETPLGWWGPLRKFRRPADVARVARPPVFGRDLIAAIASAKIVVNGAIDMAGRDRGNMRIWEALGCGAALVSDEGLYPRYIEAGRQFASYAGPEEARDVVVRLLEETERRIDLARQGNAAIRAHYSKDLQWERFVEILSKTC